MNGHKNQLSRLCKCCALYYDLNEFNETKKGRKKYICKSCELMRKEQAKIEWLRYQTEKRNEKQFKKLEESKRITNRRIKEVKSIQQKQCRKLNVEITSNNPAVDLTKITSFVVNFDE